MKKLSVGLTGGIGAGKSTVAEMLQKLGAEIVSGDELGREVLDSDMAVRNELIARLGRDIVLPTGDLNRKLIGSRVFADRELTNWLTNLTFPGIHTRWKDLRDASPKSVVVLDAALIFEWGIESEFDFVIAVRAPLKESVARSQGRFSEIELLERASMQLPVETKVSRATYLIENSGTLLGLETQVKEFWSNHILTRTT